MENYVYEKEYPMGEEVMDAIDSISPAEVLALLAKQRRFMREHMYLVFPPAPQIFDGLIKDCEAIVKEFCGKIKATIDYSSFTATIELWCTYVEFRGDEFMYTLQKLLLYATTIRFSPLTSGMLHIWIDIPYLAVFPNAKDTNRG